jgi:hypothetical protein
MALLSLCLLPIDYRAGAELPHAHSLFQLWLDASDGVVMHDHADQAPVSQPLSSPVSWFDPTFGLDGQGQHPAGTQSPDLAQQNNSAPTVSGIDLLLVALSFLPVVAGALVLEAGLNRRLVGRLPRVLSRPPRGLLATF